jgi:glucosamine--fructose-6-phosphate aminotransferase (isomerizing)
MYEANLPRGNFASGLIGLNSGGDQMVLKKKGTIDFDQVQLDDINNYFIGHVQAPTSAARHWSYDTSHPFESLSWSVVHNGVLTNDKELKRKYIPWDENTVDTSVIPNLLQHFTEECNNECPAPKTIKKVLNLLEGTFAVGIIDTDSNDVYIARQGSILHFNNSGDVSTLGGEGFTLLPEGVIMMLSRDHDEWVVIDTFETKSPFLFI